MPKFSEAQIVFVLKQADEKTTVAEIHRKVGVSEATSSKGRKKHAGLLSCEAQRLRQFDDKNKRLRNIVADLTLGKPNSSLAANNWYNKI